jgi:hypothetical protein
VNVNLLIDAIVRQTTVLIAQLATAAGVRAPLAHTANQVFVDLVRELKEQGLGNKVIADMFGLALRTYHSKIQRLSESATFRGRSLWEATLEHVQQEGTATLSEVLRRFAHDDEATVRGVLADLVDTGLVFRTGRGSATVYRAARPEESPAGGASADADALANLVWLAIHRNGPATLDQLAATVPRDPAELQAAVDHLVAERRIKQIEAVGGTSYESGECVIPFGDAAGWEAAVFDHYQAVVTAICAKIRLGAGLAHARDTVGGSTYGFTIWRGHPLEEEVLGLLGRMRAEATALREKVNAHNSEHEAPNGETIGVIAYVGQTVVEAEDRGIR